MPRRILYCYLLLLPLSVVHAATNTPAAIPWNQIGAKAGADYQGDGLTITPTANGAQLHCVFQRLDAEATPQGLWLTSTVPNTTPGAPACSRLTTDTPSDHFRVTATAIGRAENAPSSERGSVPPDSREASWTAAALCRFSDSALGTSNSALILTPTGAVSTSGQLVRFTRPNLTEEYSVTMDGLRQDFIVEEPPETSWTAAAEHSGDAAFANPHAPLVVRLSVTGATVEPAPDGTRLVLAHSGRKIAYTRLRVTDATGKQLPARIEVSPNPGVRPSPDAATPDFLEINPLGLSSTDSPPQISNPASRISNLLSILINDSSALYPIRIDPTFSDANWISMGDSPNVNNWVNAVMTDSQGNLYIGGQFTSIGHVAANDVAMWNGTNWIAFGSGISGGGGGEPGVCALALSGNTLYAAGAFSFAGGRAATNIAQWNGTNWSGLGSGISGGLAPSQPPQVFALATSGSTLYVGGQFTNAGGVLASNVAQWNGSTWSALGSGMTGLFVEESYIDSGVYALAVSGSTLYAGGYFTNASGIPANSIAQWDGNSWSALGSGITGETSGIGPGVHALAVSGGTLFAGGNFYYAGTNPASCIAQWSNGNWSALGSGVSAEVSALALSASNLFVGGEFTSAGGITASNVALWNGTNWSAVGSGLNNAAVHAMATSGSTLYAGGVFTTAGGIMTSNLAQWDGTNWSGGARSINEYVNALVVSGSTLYAGGTGNFSPPGSPSGPNFVAQWTGTKWVQLGPAFNNAVQAVAVYNNTLYAGGQFTEVGTNYHAQYMAQWNRTNWLPVTSKFGVGVGATVTTLLAGNGKLYACGNFSGYISQWNGSNWSAFGYGFNGSINALTISGNTLYAGGAFTTYGSTFMPNVAQWNGTNWSALGSGNSDLGGTVYALALYGGTLYAGGTFISGFNGSNGFDADYICQWNGTNWLPLGTGMNGDVYSLAVAGGKLYAGGNFTTAGGSAANYVAQWNGTNWSALGSGLNSQVSALAVLGSTLYAGGQFTTAGTNISYYTAEAIIPVPLSILATDANFGFTNGGFGFDIVGPPGSNVVIQTSTDLQTWVPLQTNALNPSGLLYFSDTQSPATAPRFYNVVLP